MALGHRLAPGEEPDRLAHDVIEMLVAGLRSGVPTTFVASAGPCCGEEVEGHVNAVDAAPQVAIEN